MSTLFFDTGLKTLPEILQGSCDVFLGDFVPGFLQSTFEWFDGFVLERAYFLLQDPPNSEVHRSDIGEIHWPNALPPEVSKVHVAPLESPLRSVGRDPVLLQPPVNVFCILFSPENDSALQDKLMVDLCIEFMGSTRIHFLPRTHVVLFACCGLVESQHRHWREALRTFLFSVALVTRVPLSIQQARRTFSSQKVKRYKSVLPGEILSIGHLTSNLLDLPAATHEWPRLPDYPRQRGKPI